MHILMHMIMIMECAQNGICLKNTQMPTSITDL